MPDYPRILDEYELPKPPGKKILDMQRNLSMYAWYVKTDLGWFWLDEMRADPVWQFLPNGPLHNPRYD